jgi:hypothetical protein
MTHDDLAAYIAGRCRALGMPVVSAAFGRSPIPHVTLDVMGYELTLEFAPNATAATLAIYADDAVTKFAAEWNEIQTRTHP